MDKKLVIEAIIQSLEKDFQLVQGASKDAAEYATHEEAKADSKWDTQGLEASYLAAGQAAHALELGEAIQYFRSLLETIGEDEWVQTGSMFAIENPMGKHWYFLSAKGGGASVTLDGSLVTVVTPGSPIAAKILGKSVGFEWALPNGKICSIVELS